MYMPQKKLTSRLRNGRTPPCARAVQNAFGAKPRPYDNWDESLWPSDTCATRPAPPLRRVPREYWRVRCTPVRPHGRYDDLYNKGPNCIDRTLVRVTASIPASVAAFLRRGTRAARFARSFRSPWQQRGWGFASVSSRWRRPAAPCVLSCVGRGRPLLACLLASAAAGRSLRVCLRRRRPAAPCVLACVGGGRPLPSCLLASAEAGRSLRVCLRRRRPAAPCVFVCFGQLHPTATRCAGQHTGPLCAQCCANSYLHHGR
jgi:hypothetical protein